MKIGEVARKAGIRASTIRFYEKTGVLPRAAGRTDKGVMQPKRSSSWQSSNSSVKQGSQSLKLSSCFMASEKTLQLQRDGDG